MNPETDKPGSTEDLEPTAGDSEAPVWLMIMIALLLLWGMTFLDARGGGFDSRVYEPYHSFTQLDSLQPRSGDAQLAMKGRKVYETYCTPCHQPNGQGLPGQFPPLAGSDWVAAAGPNRMIRLVLDGIQGPITVKGLQFNNAMPPQKDLLKDDDIAAVLTFVRGNKDWGNGSSAVTAEQVKSIRAKVADRSTPWSPDELLQVPDKD